MASPSARSSRYGRGGKAVDEAGLRRALCETYRALESAGLTAGSAGNVSVRCGPDMLISPTGADGRLDPDDVVLTTLAGEARSPGVPSSEWAIHAGIYRTGLGEAVIHAHPDYCVALSCLRQPIPAFHYMVAAFGGDDVPCASYAPFGTAALAETVLAALAERSACLLANHGMVTVGPTLVAALDRATTLETLARQYVLALQAGDPVLLSPEEMGAIRAQYADYERRRAARAGRG